MVGSIQEMICTGFKSIARLVMNPLKKTLASKTIMLYCTAWLSVCETIEMVKPIPREVNSTPTMTRLKFHQLPAMGSCSINTKRAERAAAITPPNSI